jgi:subtilisin family serine protease
MKKSILAVCFAAAGVLLSTSSLMAAEPASRYIVRFESEQIKAKNPSHEDVVKHLQAKLKKNMALVEKKIKPVKSARITPLWIANAFAITANEKDIKTISELPNVAEVKKAEYNIFIEKDINKKKVKPTEDVQWSVKKVRADEVWQTFKIDGRGVVVGVLDTGIDGEHEAFKDKVLAFRDFTADNSQTPVDKQGHGTHVSGSIAGLGGVGVAPGANLIVARVFDSKGGTTTDVLLNAMQWMLDPDGNPETNDAPRLVNNSWGSDDSTNRTFWVAVENWVTAGILPVFAAGNNGMWGGKVGTPAGFPHSWAVAATTKTDTLAYFSSQGPIAWDGETLMKPDISAPGADIISCAIGGGYVSNSGTSMACPHMAGVAALMYQADPTLTIEQVRGLAEDLSTDLGTAGKDGKFGSGLVDAYKIIEKIMQNSNLTKAFAAYEASLATEKALIGVTAATPLSAPLAASIIERAYDLDEGQFRALTIDVQENCGESAQALLNDVKAARTANSIHK